jgi:2-keto-3-deoxy-L-rhamnonate aldolase RhmA
MELFLFTINHTLAAEALAAGINGIIVDLENHGKKERQQGFPTEINHYNVEDLRNLRKHLPQAHIITRVNKWNDIASDEEFERVMDAGTNEILLPMVQHPTEIERALKKANGHTRISLLLETAEIMQHLHLIDTYPLKRVYVGLNDLSISEGYPNLFLPLVNGRIEKIFSHLTKIPFGVAGLTHPDCGNPIPCRLLMNEMVRQHISFTFLRRSFLKDIRHYGLRETVLAMKGEIQEMQKSDKALQQKLSNHLKEEVLKWPQFKEHFSELAEK